MPNLTASINSCGGRNEPSDHQPDGNCFQAEAKFIRNVRQSIMSTAGGHTWVDHVKLNRQARLRLFCFPYAGGGAAIYRTWQGGLPSDVEVWPIQLPGRGSRLRGTPFTRLSLLVRAVAQGLLSELGDKPFALFGHSMGALISYELAHLLRQEHGLAPTHLFVSGCRAPHIAREKRPIHGLPEPEFLEELRGLNGTSEEILQNRELMQLMMPMLRADFEVVETYKHSLRPLLNCPITVFGGLRDADVSQQNLEAWREHTTASCTVRVLPGDHFFLDTSKQLMLRTFSRELLQITERNT